MGTTPPALDTELLLQRTASWNDVPYGAYPSGQPQLTTVKMTIPPHSALPWHTRLMPNVAYLLSASLTVEEHGTGRTALCHAGELSRSRSATSIAVSPEASRRS